ncbi:MAG TPA: hypothetical protein PLD02_07235 [Saprospiraceae bacterium]|nr:hypothetical protein [Saprospiraceae bacterium]
MKSKIEILNGLIGKEIFLAGSDGGDQAYVIFNYDNFRAAERELEHHLILEVSDDMIKTKWLGQKYFPNHFDKSGFYSINHISFIASNF